MFPARELNFRSVLLSQVPHSGDFERGYDLLDKIGTGMLTHSLIFIMPGLIFTVGAFGFVQIAMRKSDGVEVVAKIIKKSKVLVECWEPNPGIVKLPPIAGDEYAGM